LTAVPVPVPARRISPRAWILTSPILLLALVPLFANYRAASRAGQTFTRDWAVDLLNSVEPYGILVTGGDNDTFPLWYVQEVEGVRRDVAVAVTSLLGTDWYVRGIIRRPVWPYDPAAGPAVYRAASWPRPDAPALRMTTREADAIPPYVQFGGPQQFIKDSIVATIPAGVLTRDQIIVLRFIKDSFPERPVYFSSASIARPLGLAPYLVTQGLAYKLVEHPVRATGTVIVATPYGMLDVPRTRALWATYSAPKSLIRQGDWVDSSSVGVPFTYVLSAYSLAEVLDRQGDHAASNQLMRTALDMAHAAHLDAIFRGRTG
jgi:hypothetical protein